MNCRVRSRVDNLSVADRTIMRGEEADCPVDRAKYLVDRGLVERVDESAAPTPAPTLRRPAEAPASPRVVKSDIAERAINPAPTGAEQQTKKG